MLTTPLWTTASTARAPSGAVARTRSIAPQPGPHRRASCLRARASADEDATGVWDAMTPSRRQSLMALMALAVPVSPLGAAQAKFVPKSKREEAGGAAVVVDSEPAKRTTTTTTTTKAVKKPASAVKTPEASFAALRVDITKLMARDKDFGPTMVRLAWHSSGTYDRMTNTGGSGGGTIRFKEELAHGGNAGLDKAVKKLEPIKKRHPDVSWADLIAYVGVVAIEEMGGPKLKFSYGRVDELDPSAVTPDGRLPAADKGDGPGPKTQKGLRDVFYRMGFDDKDIVALSGAHALGRCHADASGYVGPWTGTPLLFNNSYFVLLKGLKWEPNLETGKFQYKDPSGNLMMLPSDIALVKDPKFKRYVDKYADKKGGQDLFFKDFASAFERLELLGTKDLVELKA